MKRDAGRLWLIRALFLLSAVSLAASTGTTFQSNSIGFRFQEIAESSFQDYEYVLRVQNPNPLVTEESLFRNNTLVQKTVVTRQASPSQRKTIVQTNFDALGRETVRIRSVFDGNLLVQRSQNENSGSIVSFFTYENRRLVAQRDIYNGNLQKLSTYYRNATNGALIGIRIVTVGESPKVQFFGGLEGHGMYAEGDAESFTITTMIDGMVPTTQRWLNSQSVLSATVAYDDNGNLVVSEDSSEGLVRKTYDVRGLLIHELWITGEAAGTLVDYAYDDSDLLMYSRKEIPGTLQKVIERWYHDEVELSMKEWEGSFQVKSVRYLPGGGSIVTLFDKGRPYADVTYAGDGRRVISVVYREDT